MIGANDIAFPRLNALGYWVFLFGGLLLYYSFLGNGAPDAGWFAYPPLSSQFTYTANAGMTYWGVAIMTTGIGTISAGVNIMATVLTMRAPGMTMRRVPLFVWMSFFNSILIILLIVAILSLGTPHFRGGRHAMAVDAIAVYWIFVDAMWWIIFPTVYFPWGVPPPAH